MATPARPPQQSGPTDQLELMRVANGPALGTGRTAQAVDQATAQAKQDGDLVDTDAAMVGLAVAMGDAVDHALRRRDPFAAAAAGRELRETLLALRLSPLSRDDAPGDDDSFDLGPS